jgi:glycosyltransferase involved in cell wall biosynthesis
LHYSAAGILIFCEASQATSGSDKQTPLKLLFLSKRRPQGRDLIERPYGRFHYLPSHLARSGHQVMTLLGSYVDEQEFTGEIDGVQYQSSRMFPNLVQYRHRAIEIARAWEPDVVVGCSDTWFGILAASLARRTGARLVIDAYDNYEAYLPAARPLHWLWRRALGRADGLTAAGPQLLQLLQQSNSRAAAAVVPMCADPVFAPQAPDEARARLGLPLDRKLVGYLGTADRTRGFALLDETMTSLMAHRQDFDVVISGRSEVQLALPAGRVHKLGYIDDELMPALNSACDLLLCLNRDSAFGNYSYPVKIYEAMACGRPVLASASEPARWILADENRALVEQENAADLARQVSAMLDEPLILPAAAGWEASAGRFEALLNETG